MTDTYPNTQLHIAGKWISAQDGETIDVINPATEEVIGKVSKPILDSYTLYKIFGDD